MGRVTYLLSNEMGPDVRLSDAMLFAALSETLGDRLDPVAWEYHRPATAPVWGRDPYRMMTARTRLITDAYENSSVLEALSARILPRHAVQVEMDRIAEAGFGASLRNMREPEQYVRHCARGDRFSQHEMAIRSDRYDHPVLVCPNLNLRFVRRLLVVAGEVAAETPYRHCEETPTDLLNQDAWRLQAEDFMSPLTEEDPVWRGLQREVADRLLANFPLRSGAIDIGLRITADGAITAHVQEVIAAPPGAFDTFHADVHAYAVAIGDRLLELEPGLTDRGGPTP